MIAFTTMLKIEFKNDPNQSFALMSPQGDIDAYSVAQFREALTQHADNNRLVVDLSQVIFMDSAGLGALIGGVRLIRSKNGKVALCSTRAPIIRLLHTTGFDRIVPVRETLEEAVSALDA